MGLQTSGQISLNDIHIEAGGSTSTLVGINDSDIRDLIGKSSGAQMVFTEWYGASASITATNRRTPTATTPVTLSGLSSSGTTLIVASYFWHEDVYSQGYAPVPSVNGSAMTRDVYKWNNYSSETEYISWYRYYIGTATSVTMSRTLSPTGGYNTQGICVWECNGNLTAGATASTSGSSISINANEGEVVFVGAAHNWSAPANTNNLDQQFGAGQHKMGVDMKASSGSVTYSAGQTLYGGMAGVRYY
jgi:hypothetical protein